MKKIFSILIILFILAHVAGFYVYFVFRLREIRVEMRAALKDYPTEKLERLTLTKSEYQIARNDEGEIEWNGFMYDVARVSKLGNKVIVFALRDEAETNLLVFISRIADMTHRDDQLPPQALTRFLTLNFTLPTVLAVEKSNVSDTRKHSPFILNHFSSTILDVIAPPPRA